MTKYTLSADITQDPIADVIAHHGINPEAVRKYTLTEEYIELEYYRYNTATDALSGKDMSEIVVVRHPR